MIDLELCKQWMKIDDDVDDEIIKLVYDAAVEYIKAAVGEKVDLESSKCKVVTLAIMTTMYEAREFTNDKMSEKTYYAINSIMRQLWVESFTDDEEDTDVLENTEDTNNEQID